VKAQKPSDFFADGQGARMPIPGTVPTVVPVDHPSGDYFFTGAIGAKWGDGIPVTVNLALLKRGQEKYTINCAVCHGATGGGNGITSQYGLVGIANYHLEMYRTMADGQIFNTISKGKGQMMGYASNIPPEDRWAIVAYIRALQRSQFATVADVPENERSKFVKKP
jgi:cytochrome c